MDSLIGGLTDWIKSNRDFSSWDSVLKRATHYKDIVLNPQSHPLPGLILRVEVREAIHAVEAFINLHKSPPAASNLLVDVETILSRGPVTHEQASSGLSILRAGWEVALRQFCESNKVKFEIKDFPPTIKNMFEAVKSQYNGKVLTGNLTIDQVPKVIKWLCDPISEGDFANVDDALLRELRDLVCAPGGLTFGLLS